MTTLEQVEKLRALANVSYEEAKTALEATNGDLLEAIIYLEKQGKITAPAGDGFYSSKKTSTANEPGFNEACWEKHKHCHHGKSFMTVLKKIGRFCLDLIRRGNSNSFEVLKGEESKATIPVTVLALMLIFAFWFTIPLIIVGLFFGFRYRFQGPDFRGNTVNDAMDSAADAAENLKKSMNI